MTHLLDAALHYARDLGWPVHPVNLKKRPTTEHGFYDATTDETTIGEYFKNGAQLSIRTGAASGVFVLDIDEDPDKGYSVERSLATIEARYGPLPHTPHQRTGRGGLQYLFKYQDGLGNSAGSRLWPGVDTRGEGGYVVIAPSRNTKGNYTWIVSPDDCSLADVPAWLVELLIRPEPQPAATSATEPTKNNSTYPPLALAALIQTLNRLDDDRWSNYDHWLTIGMALHDWSGGDAQRLNVAYSLYDMYSKERAPAHYGATAEKWASFGKRSGITVGTLIAWAKEDDAGPPHPAGAQGDLPFRIYRGTAIDEIASPRQLIKGYLSIGTVALLIGASEAGKSTIAVDLANKVAQHYGVLYVAGEDAAQVRAQVRAWEITHQRARSENLAIVDGPVDLGDRTQVGTFLAAAKTLRPRLVIFDTLSTCIPGIDENSSDVGPAVAHLNYIADELDAAVLVLHHPLKYDNGTFRGHSSLMNNTHSLIVATRDAGDDLVSLSVTRHKGARAAPTCLRLVIKETDITDPDEGPIAAPVALPVSRVMLPADHLSARERAILQYLLDLDADGGATVSEICREISAQFKVTEGRVRTDIASLFRKHFISEGTQRQPRTITVAGTEAIKTDRADQVDQADQVDPFVVNAHLDTPAKAANPIGPRSDTTSQHDAENTEPDRPDRTRSGLDRTDRDQKDIPDRLIGVLSSDQAIKSRSPGGEIGACGHESCRRAGLRVCGKWEDVEEKGVYADLPGFLTGEVSAMAPPDEVIARLKRDRDDRRNDKEIAGDSPGST